MSSEIDKLDKLDKLIEIVDSSEVERELDVMVEEILEVAKRRELDLEESENIESVAKEMLKEVRKRKLSLREAIVSGLKFIKEVRREDKKEAFEEIFDEQIITLKSCACPNWIIKRLKRQKQTVVNRALELELNSVPSTHYQPYMPVVAREAVSLPDQETMFLSGIPVDEFEYDFEKIAEDTPTPYSIYYIFNVRVENIDGAKTMIEVSLEERKRRGLNIDELIAYVLHSKILTITPRTLIESLTTIYDERQLFAVKKEVESVPPVKSSHSHLKPISRFMLTTVPLDSRIISNPVACSISEYVICPAIKPQIPSLE